MIRVGVLDSGINDATRRRVLHAADDAVTALAFQVEGQAKINVRENGQIDTGFMLNSIYTVAPEGNTYRQAWSPLRRTPRANRAPP